MFHFKKILLFCLSLSATMVKGQYNDGFITYAPVKVSPTDQRILLKKIAEIDKSYDPVHKMVKKNIDGWNYHTDAISGVFHDVRASLFYAVYLMDSGTPDNQQRALAIVEKTVALQDTNSTSPSCGVWPYFEEEPLATKKSPIDYNWADFNAVSLLDIYMGHREKLPKELVCKMEKALILAAKAIQKRNAPPSYTNISIMGTYVTYVTSHLFDLDQMKVYANSRMQDFYAHTLKKGGFSEYNSPTYSIVALDELNRMQRHIVEPKFQQMVAQLYEKCWDMIARHYHKPTAQWAGPHSRSYSTLADSLFYGILKEASHGKINLGYDPDRGDVKIKHQIPKRLLPYFLTPQYPRTEIDTFENNKPEIIGTTYLTDSYALSSVSRSSMWNQRRPLTAYWGDAKRPHYLQVRLLHDDFDFSTANIFTQQRNSDILALVNFGTDGGDKHLHIDRIQDGKFKALDLRLRFEFGNCNDLSVTLPTNKPDATFTLTAQNSYTTIRLVESHFGHLKGFWQKGGNGKDCWLDYVLYAGEPKEFDLTAIDKAILVFALSFSNKKVIPTMDNIVTKTNSNVVDVIWDNLTIKGNIKPEKTLPNL